MDPYTWAQIGMAAYSIFKGLSGKKKPKVSQLEKDMLGRTEALQSESKGIRHFERRRMDDLANLRDERDSLVGRATASVNQKVGPPPEMTANSTEGSFAEDVVAQNTLRNKALSRVATMGDAAVEQQGLRDRMQYGKHGVNRAALALGMAGKLADINSWKANQNMQLRDERNQMYGDAIGTAAGIAADWWRNRQLQPVSVTAQHI